MSVIKVKYVDFHFNDGYDIEKHFIYQALIRSGHQIELSDNPDYLICSVFGHESLSEKYNDCVKLFYTGENICPDFNLYDYAIGFEYMDYGDRYLRVPNYYNPAYVPSVNRLLKKGENVEETFKEKTEFCSFVYTNGEADPIRKDFFERLSKYKKVNSGGRYLNNINQPEGVPNKLEFQKKHKFVIAFENSSHIGYTTEKLVDAFAAYSVPIYWGDPEVTRVFNPKSFISVHDYETLDDVIKEVKRIDQNDSLYKAMLEEPAFRNITECLPSTQYSYINDFIKNIVSQPKEQAFRRNRIVWGERYWRLQNKLLTCENTHENSSDGFFKRKAKYFVHRLKKLK